MNATEVTVRDAEEKWIEKYRSAVAAVPVQREQRLKLKVNLKRICATIAAIVGQTFKRFIRQIELGRATVREHQPTKHQEGLPLASDSSISEKAG